MKNPHRLDESLSYFCKKSLNGDEAIEIDLSKITVSESGHIKLIDSDDPATQPSDSEQSPPAFQEAND